MQPTSTQQQRLLDDLTVIAGEEIKSVVFTPDWFSIRAETELAALRVYYHYRNSAKGCEFIKELGAWLIPVRINN